MSSHKPFQPPTKKETAAAATPSAAAGRIASRALFGDATVVLIDHEGETYALRRTRLGKLILTK